MRKPEKAWQCLKSTTLLSTQRFENRSSQTGFAVADCRLSIELWGIPSKNQPYNRKNWNILDSGWLEVKFYWLNEQRHSRGGHWTPRIDKNLRKESERRFC